MKAIQELLLHSWRLSCIYTSQKAFALRFRTARRRDGDVISYRESATVRCVSPLLADVLIPIGNKKRNVLKIVDVFSRGYMIFQPPPRDTCRSHTRPVQQLPPYSSAMRAGINVINVEGLERVIILAGELFSGPKVEVMAENRCAAGGNCEVTLTAWCYAVSL